MGSPFTPAAAAAGYATQFATQNIAPPNSIYISQDDTLFFYCVPSVACTLRIGLRYLLPTGEIKVGEYDLTTVATRSPQVLIQNLGEGFILGVNVFCLTQALRRGQCWIKFVLQRGGLNNQQLTQTICQGYVTEYTSLFWPSAQTDYELSGNGNIRSITGTVPAAGAEIAETVPAGAVWRLLAFFFAFTASATVATRTIEFTIDDGANVFFQYAATPQITAGQGQFFSFAQGSPVFNLGNRTLENLGMGILLPATFRIRTLTGSIQVGDQYSAIQYLVEEWLQP